LGKHSHKRLPVPIVQAFLNGKLQAGGSVRHVQIMRRSSAQRFRRRRWRERAKLNESGGGWARLGKMAGDAR
jgi:hypothetical protein